MSNIPYMMPNNEVLVKVINDMGSHGRVIKEMYNNNYDVAMFFVYSMHESMGIEYNVAYDYMFYQGAYNDLVEALMVEVDNS